MTRMINANILLNWYKKEARTFPWRSNSDPFKVLITGILLRKTTANQVNGIYQDIMAKYPTPKDVADEFVEKLENVLRPLGLYRIRAKEMKKMCNIILHEYGGKIPEDYESLIKLPGVNDYIANSVLCFSYNKRVALVDTNIIRIYRRLSGNSGSNKKIIRDIASKNLPKKNYKEFNWALLDLGAKVCRAKKPQCNKCPIIINCIYSTQITSLNTSY